MPTSDASSFTRYRKAQATQSGDTQPKDIKSVNRLTQYVTPLSAAGSTKNFLPSLTDKKTTPLVQLRINVDTGNGKRKVVHPNANNNF
jgi:hypothetical protein